MNRLLSAMKMDVLVQWRTNLYFIGIFAGILIAITLSQLTTASQLFSLVPTFMLLVVGGSTLLYVSGLILFEKDEGTLNAVIVSPLTTGEYLWSKIITLTALATLEALIMVGGAMLILSFSEAVVLPNIPILLLGVVAIGVMYTLVGIIMIVRYEKITDFLMPMAAVATILQLPFLYFIGWIKSPLFLIIPTSAPTMIMQGASQTLTAGEWIYGIVVTILLLAGLTYWAFRAFQKHIIEG